MYAKFRQHKTQKKRSKL